MTAGVQPADAQPIRVICTKANGARALFKEYPAEQRDQARIDAAALRAYGIPAEVDGEPAP
jgi:hypothetical protein